MPLYVPASYPLGLGDGRPGTTTILGTKKSVPAGLEAALEYNGLTMNVQANADRYHIDSIDGLYDADVRDMRDQNTADDGETPYNSFYGGRTITISGTIQTYNVAKIRDMQQALRAAFADIRNEYPLHFRVGDYTRDHFINCKKIGPIAGMEQQSDLKIARQFQITLRASNPRFLSFYARFLDVKPPVTSSSTLYAFPIAQNNGNYTAKTVFKIFGPFSNGCYVINDDTHESFLISGHMELGNYLIFDTEAKSLHDAFGNNRWDMLEDDSDYISLQGITANTTGSNHLFYYGDVPRILISWHDSWI